MKPELRYCHFCGHNVQLDLSGGQSVGTTQLPRHTDDRFGRTCLGSGRLDHQPQTRQSKCPRCTMTVDLKTDGSPKAHKVYSEERGRAIACTG